MDALGFKETRESTLPESKIPVRPEKMSFFKGRGCNVFQTIQFFRDCVKNFGGFVFGLVFEPGICGDPRFADQPGFFSGSSLTMQCLLMMVSIVPGIAMKFS